MKKLFSDFFFYNRQQKIGVIIFGMLTLVNVTILWFDPFADHSKIDFSQFEKELAELKKAHLEKDFAISSVDENQPQTRSHQAFDPNTASKEVLVQNGIPEKLAERITRFREKGGKFKNTEDLKKIYGLPEELFAQLEPFISIQQEKRREEKKQASEAINPKNFTVELNTADSVSLLSLPGIGPVFAKRIIAYRNKLGGFFSSEQLKEVFGMDSLKLIAIRDKIALDPSGIRKINVNSAGKEQLESHPYIGYKLGKRIVAFREQHGPFQTISELKSLEGIEPSKLDKFLPYISLD